MAALSIMSPPFHDWSLTLGSLDPWTCKRSSRAIDMFHRRWGLDLWIPQVSVLGVLMIDPQHTSTDKYNNNDNNENENENENGASD